MAGLNNFMNNEIMIYNDIYTKKMFKLMNFVHTLWIFI